MTVASASGGATRRRRRRPRRNALLAALAGLLALATMYAGPVGASAGRPPAAGPGNAPKTAQPKPAAHPTQGICATSVKAGFAKCLSVRRTDVAAHKGTFAADAAPSGYGPSDLQSAYNLAPAAGGSGETVAIVDAFDDPNAEADLQVYRSEYGLPACNSANGCFSKVAQDGTTSYPPRNASWAQEVSLDLDMVSAICPNCHILLVEATDNSLDNLGAAVNEAVALGAKYVSNSYGGNEDPDESSADAQFYNHPGVVVTASTGDAGFGVEYPAASRYVAAVGGTTLTRDISAPRGWAETAWGNGQSGVFGDGAGSGCSVAEAKPSWQTDSGCAKRTVADVSADANPNTGVAVYDTFGTSGWAVFGGTSVASPIIASTYALAGTPTAGSYPSSYPYADPSNLNDVTSGSNGSCSPSYLCTAGPGYDGPTGLGSPDGLRAFTIGMHGDITGTVTDAGSGKAISGAVISAGGRSATTDGSGRYSLFEPVGMYTETVSAFGYASATITGVAVIDGGTITEDAGLTPVPLATVRGTVADGSGQGWGLHASISVPGMPGGPVWTDPVTGAYSLELPQNTTSALTVSTDLPGYPIVKNLVAVGTSALTHNITMPVNTATCTAPGYRFSLGAPALSENFDDYAGDGATSAPPGWTVQDTAGNGEAWQFNDALPNLTGGSGFFAVINSNQFAAGNTQDTSLITPVLDLSGDASPVLQFDNDYLDAVAGQTGAVDVSANGGQTWTNVWQHTTDSKRGPDLETVPIPQVARNATARVRFHYTATAGKWWQIDNVAVSNRTCNPLPGGLVVGQTTDANTGAGLDGATLTEVGAPSVTATTQPTGDPAIRDGYYSLFSPLTGSQQFAAAKRGGYATTTATVNVTQRSASRADIAVAAGQLSISPPSISKSVALGSTTTAIVTISNTGTAPTSVTLDERGGASAALSAKGAQLKLVAVGGPHGTASPGTVDPQAATGPPMKAEPAAGSSWSTIAPYPTPSGSGVGDFGNRADVIDGKVYSVGSAWSGEKTHAFVYDPTANRWSRIADSLVPRDNSAVVADNGKLYVNGGFDSAGDRMAETDVYDPATDTWTKLAPNPAPTSSMGVAVANGVIYLVGGCQNATNCPGSATVETYDPQTNSWASVAPYPHPDSWLSCGGIDGKVYCAGGINSSTTYADGYVYNPLTDSWSPIASLPIDLWGSVAAAANGRLVISGGATNHSTSVTNQGYAYDPATDTWSPIPNAQYPSYRAAGACGFYKIGGITPPQVFEPSERLSGLTQCGTTDVPWMSENRTTATLPPGQSTRVTVRLSATSGGQVTQPGTYTAQLGFEQDTPYEVFPENLTMTVTPPAPGARSPGR